MSNKTVSEVMSSRELVAVKPTTMVESAKKLTDERGISHLLVMESQKLVGIVCICDFDAARVGAQISDCVTGMPTTVAPSISVLDAVEVMNAGAISCLPVIDGANVVGVLTRTDLRRAGIASDILGPEAQCASCGTTRHVRAHEATGEEGLCLDCRRQSTPPHWTEDVGGGS